MIARKIDNYKLDCAFQNYKTITNAISSAVSKDFQKQADYLITLNEKTNQKIFDNQSNIMAANELVYEPVSKVEMITNSENDPLPLSNKETIVIKEN